MQVNQTLTVPEPERVAALHRLNLVSSAAEERFDRITRMAKERFGVPMAVVTLVDAVNTVVKAPEEMTHVVVPREQSFCNVAIETPDILMVTDATADSRFATLPSVLKDSGIRFYAGRPLNAEPGARVGTLCLYDTKPREFSADELRQLDELGVWAEAELQDSADRNRARFIQQALLPTLPAASGYDVAGLCLPKTDVGGDFYSWRELGEHMSLAIADVMGKGTAAALMAATVRSALHSTVVPDPGVALGVASELLARDLECTSTFATAFLATLNMATGVLRYADAGHGLSIVVSPDGSYRRLHGDGLPLGIGEAGSWTTHTVELQPGEMLATFTDGVLDLFDGTLKALDHVTALIAGTDPAQAVSKLRSLQEQTIADDDFTALIVRRRPGNSVELGAPAPTTAHIQQRRAG